MDRNDVIALACLALSAAACGSTDEPRRASATWRMDTSGYESLPNEVFASINDLPSFRGESETGLRRDDRGGYIMSVIGDDGQERLAFRLEMLGQGTYDLRSGLAVLTYRDVHHSNVGAGSGTLSLRVDDNDRLAGDFEGRLCQDGGSCWSFYDGEFKVFNDTGEELADSVPLVTLPQPPGEPPPVVDPGKPLPPEPVVQPPAPPPSGYPALGPDRRSRIIWQEGVRTFEAEGEEGIECNNEACVMFSTALDTNGQSLTLILVLPTLDVASYTFSPQAMLPSVGYETSTQEFLTSEQSATGYITLEGRSGDVVWGVFEVQLCPAEGVAGRCREITVGRYAAVVD